MTLVPLATAQAGGLLCVLVLTTASALCDTWPNSCAPAKALLDPGPVRFGTAVCVELRARARGQWPWPWQRRRQVAAVVVPGQGGWGMPMGSAAGDGGLQAVNRPAHRRAPGPCPMHG